MPALWIQNARVIDPASRRDAFGDLFLDQGRVVARREAPGPSAVLRIVLDDPR